MNSTTCRTGSSQPGRLCLRRGLTLIELLVVLCILGVLVALLLPSVHRGREPARRTQCRNNLKQILLAMHNYREVHGAFPPAYTVDANGKPLHSWRTLLLPYLDQRPLYDTVDLSKPWDDPANAVARETLLTVYQCPAIPPSTSQATHQPSQTTYLAVVTPTSALRPIEPRKLSEITDGLSETLVLIDVDAEHAVPWMSPQDADEALILSLDEKSKLPHQGGMHAATADGVARFLSAKLTAETRRALISCAGGDKVPEEW